MSPIAFVTSNSEKFEVARHICEEAGIPIEQMYFDIEEIQGEDPLTIVKHKAAAAFAAHGKPVVVSDDSWDISALNGFPGAYMKSINFWFTPDDYLRLMKGVDDRTVVLHQYLAYADEHEVLVFNGNIPGTVLAEAQGKFIPHKAWMSVVTMDGDNGKSLSEVFAGTQRLEKGKYSKRLDGWHELIKWYKGKHSWKNYILHGMA